MFRNNNVHSDQGNERLSNVSKVYNIRYHRSDVICYLVYFDCSYSVLFSQSNASVFLFTEKSATVHYHWSWQKKRQSLLRSICVCTMYYPNVVFSCFVFVFIFGFFFCCFLLWGAAKGYSQLHALSLLFSGNLQRYESTTEDACVWVVSLRK